MLVDHPDQELVGFLLAGFDYGFQIGLSQLPVKSHACKNLLSTRKEPETVADLLLQEVEKGYLMGPFHDIPSQFQVYRVNPLGLVRGKWPPFKPRLIVDFSSPHNKPVLSLNDMIPKDEYSLKYITIDKAIEIILALGKGTMCMKTDGRDAFKQIPVHPDFWPLQMVKFQQQFYFFTRLCFGSRSSPFIFDQFSSAVCWIAEHVFGVQNLLHLLDDYIAFIPSSADGVAEMARFLKVFSDLNIPLSESKTCGPTTRIEYLGLILDTCKMQVELPEVKLQRICSFIVRFLNRSTVTKVELLQILGHFQFAARAVPVARPFVSHLLSIAHSVSELHHHVRLDRDSRLDLSSWLSFLQNWHGVSMFLDGKITRANDIDLSTDSSGNPALGFGGYLRGQWFQGHWPAALFQTDAPSMAFLELVPVLVSAKLWGKELAGKRVCLYCDNSAVVQIIRKGRSREKRINKLMRVLSLCQAEMSFVFLAEYIPTADNGVADSLSRFQGHRFRSLAPDAQQQPSTIPSEIWDLLTV